MNTINLKLKDSTVANLVSENIKNAHVFKKHGIDFCCGGGVSISQACSDNGISLEEVLQDLSNVNVLIDKAHDYQSWTVDYLIMHIENIHHTYVRESVPMLAEYAEKVARVHGHHYTELIEIKDLVEELATDLVNHMLKEEQILFPAIRRIVLNQANETDADLLGFNVSAPIDVMKADHDNAGKILKKLAELTQGYEPPIGACNTYRAFYAKLEEFEQDIHLHVHLENNILFPKAIELNKIL
jgi:regulator of cell morphogenesis and NO signaling